MQRSFAINFQNPYTCNSNIIIWAYNHFRPNTVKHRFLKFIYYGISLVIRRILFSLIRFNSIGYTSGAIDGKKFPLRSLNSQFHSIYFKEYSRCYEPEVFAAIDLFLPENGVFIDVGSNWGHHSFIAISRKNASTIAFEPNKMSYGCLEKISKALGYDNKLTPYNLGVGNEVGNFELVQSRFESGLASMSDEFNALVQSSYKLWPEKLLDKITFKKDYVEIVEVVSLDSCIVGNVCSVDLIKLDCEGVELNALKGAVETLKKYSPTIIFEVHSGQSFSKLDKFKKFFDPLGYNLYELRADITKGQCHLKPIEALNADTWCNVIATKHIMNS